MACISCFLLKQFSWKVGNEMKYLSAVDEVNGFSKPGLPRNSQYPYPFYVLDIWYIFCRFHCYLNFIIEVISRIPVMLCIYDSCMNGCATTLNQDSRILYDIAPAHIPF